MSVFNKMVRKASPDWNTSAGPDRGRESQRGREHCVKRHISGTLERKLKASTRWDCRGDGSVMFNLLIVLEGIPSTKALKNVQ